MATLKDFFGIRGMFDKEIGDFSERQWGDFVSGTTAREVLIPKDVAPVVSTSKPMDLSTKVGTLAGAATTAAAATRATAASMADLEKLTTRIWERPRMSGKSATEVWVDEYMTRPERVAAEKIWTGGRAFGKSSEWLVRPSDLSAGTAAVKGRDMETALDRIMREEREAEERELKLRQAETRARRERQEAAWAEAMAAFSLLAPDLAPPSGTGRERLIDLLHRCDFRRTASDYNYHAGYVEKIETQVDGWGARDTSDLRAHLEARRDLQRRREARANPAIQAVDDDLTLSPELEMLLAGEIEQQQAAARAVW